MKLSSLSLDLETTPGADLMECCREAQRLADMLTLDVVFRFSGIGCRAHPGGCAFDLRDKCWHAMSLRGCRTVSNGKRT